MQIGCTKFLAFETTESYDFRLVACKKVILISALGWHLQERWFFFSPHHQTRHNHFRIGDLVCLGAVLRRVGALKSNVAILEEYGLEGAVVVVGFVLVVALGILEVRKEGTFEFTKSVLLTVVDSAEVFNPFSTFYRRLAEYFNVDHQSMTISVFPPSIEEEV